MSVLERVRQELDDLAIQLRTVTGKQAGPRAADLIEELLAEHFAPVDPGGVRRCEGCPSTFRRAYPWQVHCSTACSKRQANRAYRERQRAKRGAS